MLFFIKEKRSEFKMSDPLSRLSWDDLRVVKAIGEHGSLATAAASLGVNNSTMFRRLAQVEDALKVSLFDRRRTGYVATDAGTEVITLAQNIELEIIGVTTRFSGSDAGYAGDLRITTSDSLAYNLIVPIVADFRRENPGIRCEILIANSPLNLARGSRMSQFGRLLLRRRTSLDEKSQISPGRYMRSDTRALNLVPWKTLSTSNGPHSQGRFPALSHPNVLRRSCLMKTSPIEATLFYVSQLQSKPE